MKKTAKHFYFWLSLITLCGLGIRMLNINYSSLWADELYSALLAHPGNSWYEVLYIQRAYQPPLYAFILWIWVKIFAYNEFYIRLLTVLAGTACIWVSGILGKKIKNPQLGIILALMVTFNPVQIWYSLEARFYVFIYLFSALSLLLYWYIITHKPVNKAIYLVKAGVDAALCYFHHFGIIFIFAQFIFDIALWYKSKDHSLFFTKLASFLLAGLLYAPWVLWGLTEGMAVKQYWLKTIDIGSYLTFNLGYPFVINLLTIFFIAVFLWQIFKQRNLLFSLFPFLCFMVTLVPVIYSIIKMPLLVDRYAMVMAPALYCMVALGILYLLNWFEHNALWKYLTGIACMLAFAWPGLSESFFDKSKLDKQPWREMGQWLNQQPDFDSTPIYVNGAFVKKMVNIDFYLKNNEKALALQSLVPGQHKKMYLVETNAVWKIKDSVLKRLDSSYTISQIPFNKGKVNFGNIYVCEKK